MAPEFGDSSPDPFDADYLKSLSPLALSEALLDEAFSTLTQLPERERDDAAARVIDICRALSEDEKTMLETHEELDKELREKMEATGVGPGGESLTERRENAAKIIGQLKENVENGLQAGETGGWTEMHTKNALSSICNERAQADMSSSEDYVRETALESLGTLGYRGIVLVHNALTGDYASYDPGIEALQEAVEQESLGLSDSKEAADLVMDLMKEKGPEAQDTLGDLALDILVHLRGWNGSLPRATVEYALLVARLAVIARDRSQSL